MAVDIHEQVNPEVSLPLNQVVLGDCVEVMAGWPENSVDAIVTDPPYGISFMGKEWDRALPPRVAFEQMIRVLKPGALAFVMSSPRQDVLWRMLAMLEGVGFELRQSFVSWIYKSGFPKALDVSKGIDRKLGLDREIIKKNPNLKGRKEFGKANERVWNIDRSNSEAGLYAGVRDYSITEPASDLAKQWEGWKSQTGLKPAAECILMVNKPRSEQTIVDNVLRWGTGAINVDACRIPFSERWTRSTPYIDDMRGNNYGRSTGVIPMPPQEGNQKGRFPANLLISDGALDTGEITKSGILEPHHHISEERAVYGEYAGRESIASYGDKGGTFRYFDLDAWAEHHGFLDVAKPSKAERDFGLNYFQEKQVEQRYGSIQRVKGESFIDPDGKKHQRLSDNIQKRRNTHPTCKPVKLMSYLIELGCPPKGIVVDPFVGSGTTCIAAKRLRRRWIGIEINPEYADIARARIDIKGPLDQFMEAEK